MGAWGTAISSNDTYADIYDEFFDLYNDGQSVEDISKKLITDNQETINEPEDSNNFWFALAKAQWECKQLDTEILERVKQIIETGLDLEVWRRLDADEKDIKKRKVVLDKFLADLQTERPKAKSRKKKVIKQPPFEKGDCLTFKLANGNYGGAVVLEAIKDTEYGHTLLATTRINQPTKPTKKDFENAEVLIANYANWDNNFNIKWYLPIRHKLIAHLIEKVDTIEVQINYDINKSMNGFVADFDVWVIQVADQQFESEKTKPKPTTKQTIKALTKKSKWKLW
ncbi:hypothetical protein DC498_25580 [Terrimonas sp.]|uniref:hypothetical protein n=1 Tax=Terrimonas sp. TaxID=1914338 RepID=UPI000D50F1D5|nr:hypothetical protein [Terrimonas sp.]PVD49341.1 hypothetical protein DC498_25580 [Terrimonas sp.]